MTILTEPPSSEAQPSSLIGRKIVSTVLGIGITLGSGLYLGITQGLSTSINNQARTQPKVSRADYERIKLDMTQAEVEAILNPGIEVRRSKDSNWLIWENSDQSKIEAEFHDGVLVYKEQSGLK
ncbi:hypothetical protein [Adonisia turfae]|uniref:Uncharacterized protein n=1 Tax=Adonisia turfae CCMR0081 TaxID=2292702 RepID=A0A6M0RED2_9CYAN|nr:hypothetical protein [Adonisia turfae]NEZ54223.1 hypothetical protein [Adonisia turfae CCMR0081]